MNLKPKVMAKSAVKILKIEPLTHDVLRFEVEKPKGYTFVPGQATSVAINQKGREDDARPFTFTSLPDEDHLEFVIKIYADREGMTSALRNVEVGDELLIADPWGNIAYKGPGLFIAGGAGITPFIAIFKQLQKEDALQGSQLLFGNKTRDDIILEDWLNILLGDACVHVLSKEDVPGYVHGRIDEEMIGIHYNGGNIYVCGPPPMLEEIGGELDFIGFPPDLVVKEEF